MLLDQGATVWEYTPVKTLLSTAHIPPPQNSSSLLGCSYTQWGEEAEAEEEAEKEAEEEAEEAEEEEEALQHTSCNRTHRNNNLEGKRSA